jgi:glycine cleavage system H protein
MRPEELKYTADHMWVAVEGEAARIGISDYAQKQMEEVVFVEFLEVGKKLVRGQIFGRVESVKSVSDLTAPVSGELLELNKSVSDSPAAVNEDPLGAGWLALARLEKPEELKALLSYDAYQKSLNP